MQAITKEFPGVRALDNVSFSVGRGEIHGLCGENGAGKSTLIKILGGVYGYGSYAGDLRINGKPQTFQSVRDAEQAGIAVIHQELALVPEMTAAENIYLGREPGRFGVIDTARLRHEAEVQLAAFGLTIPLHTPIRELGIGQQQLVEIAKALSRRWDTETAAQLLVLDEPTAALTDNEVDTLHQILIRLRETGVACIYITHKLKEIFQIADRVTVLRDGKTVATESPHSPTCSEETLISQMVGRALTARFPERQKGRTPENVALRVEQLSTYPAAPPQLQDISFTVNRGEILGIAGLMGAGRTELITTLFGAYAGRWTGQITIDGMPVDIRSPLAAIQHGIALVSEDRKRYGLLLDMDIVRNMTLASLRGPSDIAAYGVVNENNARKRTEPYVESLQIKTASLAAPVNQLSGGNQQKVVLGKWLMTAPKVLFLDEPTRGIDVGAKAEIHTLMAELAAAGVAIVFVSSELPEILGMSDRVLVLHAGRITGEFINKALTQADIMRCAAGG